MATPPATPRTVSPTTVMPIVISPSSKVSSARPKISFDKYITDDKDDKDDKNEGPTFSIGLDFDNGESDDKDDKDEKDWCMY
jgi:hypothetical protein